MRHDPPEVNRRSSFAFAIVLTQGRRCPPPVGRLHLRARHATVAAPASPAVPSWRPPVCRAHAGLMTRRSPYDRDLHRLGFLRHRHECDGRGAIALIIDRMAHGSIGEATWRTPALAFGRHGLTALSALRSGWILLPVTVRKSARKSCRCCSAPARFRRARTVVSSVIGRLALVVGGLCHVELTTIGTSGHPSMKDGRTMSTVRIGVLTSGGDAQGANATVRAWWCARLCQGRSPMRSWALAGCM